MGTGKRGGRRRGPSGRSAGGSENIPEVELEGRRYPVPDGPALRHARTVLKKGGDLSDFVRKMRIKGEERAVYTYRGSDGRRHVYILDRKKRKAVPFDRALEFHKGRSEYSRASDESRRASVVLPVPTEAWMKRPGKYDVKGIDDGTLKTVDNPEEVISRRMKELSKKSVEKRKRKKSKKGSAERSAEITRNEKIQKEKEKSEPLSVPKWYGKEINESFSKELKKAETPEDIIKLTSKALSQLEEELSYWNSRSDTLPDNDEAFPEAMEKVFGGFYSSAPIIVSSAVNKLKKLGLSKKEFVKYFSDLYNLSMKKFMENTYYIKNDTLGSLDFRLINTPDLLEEREGAYKHFLRGLRDMIELGRKYSGIGEKYRTGLGFSTQDIVENISVGNRSILMLPYSIELARDHFIEGTFEGKYGKDSVLVGRTYPLNMSHFGNYIRNKKDWEDDLPFTLVDLLKRGKLSADLYSKYFPVVLPNRLPGPDDFKIVMNFGDYNSFRNFPNIGDLKNFFEYNRMNRTWVSKKKFGEMDDKEKAELREFLESFLPAEKVKTLLESPKFKGPTELIKKALKKKGSLFTVFNEPFTAHITGYPSIVTVLNGSLPEKISRLYYLHPYSGKKISLAESLTGSDKGKIFGITSPELIKKIADRETLPLIDLRPSADSGGVESGVIKVNNGEKILKETAGTVVAPGRDVVVVPSKEKGIDLLKKIGNNKKVIFYGKKGKIEFPGINDIKFVSNPKDAEIIIFTDDSKILRDFPKAAINNVKVGTGPIDLTSVRFTDGSLPEEIEDIIDDLGENKKDSVWNLYVSLFGRKILFVEPEDFDDSDPVSLLKILTPFSDSISALTDAKTSGKVKDPDEIMRNLEKLFGSSSSGRKK